MPITKNEGRSEVKSATVTFRVTDVAAGADEQAILMPANSTIISGEVVTEQGWNSTSTDVIDVGDAGSQNRYLNDGNFRAAGARVALVPTGHVYTSPTWVTVRWASGGGTPNTGRSRLEIQYIELGRANSTVS